MDTLTPEFQTKLVSLLLQDSAFVNKFKHKIRPDLWDDKSEREIVSYFLRFYEKYGFPERSMFIDMMVNDGYDESSTSSIISALYSPVLNSSYVIDSFIDYVRRHEIKGALLECSGLLNSGSYDEITKVMKQATSAYSSSDSIGNIFMDDLKSIISNVNKSHDCIPTGIFLVDEALFGGAVRGTLNVIMTPPNRGKSTALVNLGKNAILNGFKVLHYTLELSASIIERRYFMSIVGMSKEEMRHKKKTAYDSILTKICKCEKNCLIIKEFISHPCYIETLCSHIATIKDMFGFFPDVIIVDYGSLVSVKDKREDKRHEIAEVYKGLREISNEFNSVLWTASQTHRNGDKEELITLNSLAECYEIGAISDVIISINQTIDEKTSIPQTARLFFAKNRDNASEITVQVETNWAKSQIKNLC